MYNLVSVIIATYNRSHYLPEAIESVLNQTYKDFEIIVVDDGSTDETRTVVKRYGKRVGYIYQENAGVLSARNTGIKNSKGVFLAFLDDDDLWLERMLERTVETLEKSGEDVGVAYVDCRYFKESERNKLINKGMRHYSGDVFDELLKANFMPINTVLIKKECIDKVGGFDETIEGYEDWDLLLRIAFAGFKFEFIDERLSFIRVHDTHMSSRLLMMKRNSLKVIEKLGSMPGKSLKQGYWIKKTLAKRHLSLGWYLTLNGHRDEGREEIRRAVPRGVKQILQKWIAILLTSIHNTVLLQKINTFIEFMFGQRNPYRSK